MARSPNPRLQRTPLRAPLSRKPLGRTEVLFISIVTLSVNVAAAANKEVPFATPRELAGAWVGHSSDDVAYRLELNLDGGGFLAFTYPFLEPQFYRVTKWSVAGRRFGAGAVSEVYPEESLQVEGKAWLNKLDLEIKRKWRNGSSKCTLQLFPETTTLRSYDLMREGMLKRRPQVRP